MTYPDAEIDGVISTYADLDRDEPWHRLPAGWTAEGEARVFLLLDLDAHARRFSARWSETVAGHTVTYLDGRAVEIEPPLPALVGEVLDPPPAQVIDWTEPPAEPPVIDAPPAAGDDDPLLACLDFPVPGGKSV